MLIAFTPAAAQTVPPADGPITCTSPVSVADSAKGLMQRFGQEAVIADDLYTGVEDITYRGVTLLPHSPEWRIDVLFADEAMSRVARLTLRDAKTSHWNVAGVTIGSTLAEVQKINRKPFLITGIDSDFSGFVVNWKGGVLGRPLPGGCEIVVRFGRGKDGRRAPGGDPVASDNATMRTWGPVVEQIEVRFPEK
ncbi:MULTISPECIES: hypothetical protein [unclassified Bradyrhizobium]|uniref:hypothetical protein n=1 Tax=unclassified Bradyrhizobium TaxID=2631580 RepID=UPI0024E14273|nr:MULTISPECIES: hypothetical protein [unclassified Bradyrhizobium]